jgi:hypothetical protein
LTKKLTLSTRVALYQGHAPQLAPTPDWTGSTEQFWAANPANPPREMNDLYGISQDGKNHRIDRGAQVDSA